MTVKEAIKLFAYGTAYEIRGSYSGKVYYKSYFNSNKYLDKFANIKVTDEPFYAEIVLRGTDNNHWCIPVIVICIDEFDLCKNEVEKESDDE